jgi:hypothetical protein
MLLFVSILKLVAEIALLAIAGQWLLGLLAGAKRETNTFYQLFGSDDAAVCAGARLITPKVVIDRHVPLVASACCCPLCGSPPR